MSSGRARNADRNADTNTAGTLVRKKTIVCNRWGRRARERGRPVASAVMLLTLHVLALSLLSPLSALQSASLMTRRSALLAAPGAALIFSRSAHAEEEVPAPPAAAANGPIAYDDLLMKLRSCRDGAACQVRKVVFTTANGESGEAIFTDDTTHPIVGIPPDNPNSDSSPYKLVAKCRDAKIPYSFPFSDLSKYRKN